MSRTKQTPRSASGQPRKALANKNARTPPKFEEAKSLAKMQEVVSLVTPKKNHEKVKTKSISPPKKS